MKITFKIIALALLVFASFTTVEAQRGGRGGDRNVDHQARAEKQAEKMKSELGLSDKQAEQIKEINLKYAQKAQEKRQEKAADREKMKTEREAVQAQHEKEVESVLTKEQREKWAQIRQERQARQESRATEDGKMKDKSSKKPMKKGGKRAKKMKPDTSQDQ